MSGEDFIKLPNGKKIYMKDNYGKVNSDDIKSKKSKFLIEIFDRENPDNRLNSSEIGSLFSSLKDYAQQDGNNELSSAELMGFIKENVPEDFIKYIKPKDMMNFLETIQEKSDEALKNSEKTEIHIVKTFDKIFPELSYLELGPDNNIDLSKLTFENIKKQYPEDKYDIKTTSETQYIADFADGRSIVSQEKIPFDDPYYADAKKIFSRTYDTYTITNKETGEVVVDARGTNGAIESIIIKDETNGREYSILKSDNNSARISTNPNKEMVCDRTIDINNGKINYAQDNDKNYYFDNGIIETMRTNEYTINYTNGIPDRDETDIKKEAGEKKIVAPELKDLLASSNIDSQKLTELITRSVNSNNIGADMDEYYALTGRELTDDIQNSNLPQDLKTKLLNSICEPFVDSKYYDAHKQIENSKIDNPPYYTSEDEYKVTYNGPIITVLNKTTGEISRINLRSLMKDMNYSKKSWLEKSLKTLQSFPGEILENMDIEIAQFMTMTKEDRSDGLRKMRAAAFYEDNVMHTPRLDRHKGSIIIHEMAHGIDDVSGSDNPGFMSERGKFKEVYDKCMAKYEASGHKRFDDMHPMKSIPIFPINKGTNYATYNENEAFAICMEIIFGYSDSNTKFVKNYMPELIDAARDLYLEIRKMKREERRAKV